jgi:hypothetical protein
MINEYWLLLNKNKQYRKGQHEKKDNLSKSNFTFWIDCFLLELL